MPPQFTRPIVMIGFMAAGKTAVGQEYAARHGLEFIDTDHLVIERHGSIADIFATRGETAFRDLEARTVAEVLDGVGARVVSLGGGAVLNPRTQAILGNATVVFLDTDLETVLPRIGGNTGRPLLAGDAAERWTELAVVRRPIYENLADVVLDARGATINELADQLDRILDRVLDVETKER